MVSSLDKLSLRLACITQPPDNTEYPQTAVIPNTNNFAWTRLFNNLLQIEKSFSPTYLNLDTLAKAQAIFDQYIRSMSEQGFEINKELVWRDTKPLHLAASNGCLFTLSSLIKHGADVNLLKSADNTYGGTALYEAALKNQLKAAEILIQNGADVNKPYSLGGDTSLPIHTATSPEMCTLLVKNGCFVNSRGTKVFQESALHWAAHCARPDTIFTLLKLGAKDIPIPGKRTALEVAKKVHDKSYSVLMGGSYNPSVTGLSVSLLSNPDLINAIATLGQILEKEDLEDKKPREVKCKEYFVFLTTAFKPQCGLEYAEVKFHRTMQDATDGIIAFVSWDRGLLNNGNLNYIKDYFFQETGEHIFGKMVRTLKITNTCLSERMKGGFLDPDGVHYIADLIACNPQIDSIDLSYTELSDKEVRMLLSALDKNTRLQHLILEGNYVSRELLAECEMKLKKNQI